MANLVAVAVSPDSLKRGKRYIMLPFQQRRSLHLTLGYEIPVMSLENGRRAVEERYNWGNEEKKLLRLYEKIRG